MRPSKIKLALTKIAHWEYWPFEVVYFPVLLYYLWLSLKARSFFFFSASNPSIETGGMMGESKYGILKNISDEVKAVTLFFSKETSVSEILMGIAKNNILYPLIAKPDVGERGTGVEKINSEKELINYLHYNKNDLLIQEYVNFEIELGVFYYRFPDQEKGTISSIVQKDFLKVTGDGSSTLKELMIKNPRAGFQFERLNSKLALDEVPEEGKEIVLEPIGNHCRGTAFLNANYIIDQDLINVFDEISKSIPGFFFGRYDLRCSTIENLKLRRDIKIVELNGAGSEPGHIYHPGASLFEAWKVLHFHWKVLYEISAQNHAKGVPYMTFKEARKRYRTLKGDKK